MTSLVYDDSARLICTGCEADAHAKSVTQDVALKMVIGPPAAAVLGSLTICVPLVSLIAPGLFGLIAVLSAVSGVRLAMAKGDGMDSTRQALLWISAVIGGLWGVGLMIIQVFSWIGLAFM